MLAHLSHPGILTLIQPLTKGSYHKPNGSSKDILYYVMELAECGDLYDFVLAKEGLSEIWARHFLQQLLKSIEYLHS